MDHIKKHWALILFIFAFIAFGLSNSADLSTSYWIALMLASLFAYINTDLLNMNNNFFSKTTWTILFTFALIIAYVSVKEQNFFQSVTEFLFNLGLFLAANAAANFKGKGE